MMKCWRMLDGLVRRFATAQAGVAAVEFALVVPIMLTIYLGTTEASALISMDRKVQSVAGSLGDLVARENASISGATLLDYFQASSGIMTPFANTELKQTVSLVKVEADETTKVIWSREFADGVISISTDHPAGTSYGLPSDMTNIAKDSYVIVSEAGYSYKPLFGLVFDQAVDLYRESFYIPRFGEPIALK